MRDEAEQLENLREIEAALKEAVVDTDEPAARVRLLNLLHDVLNRIATISV